MVVPAIHLDVLTCDYLRHPLESRLCYSARANTAIPRDSSLSCTSTYTLLYRPASTATYVHTRLDSRIRTSPWQPRLTLCALNRTSGRRLGGSVTVDVMGRVATLRLAAAPGSRRAKAPTNHGARCTVPDRASSFDEEPGCARCPTLAVNRIRVRCA